MSMRSSKRKQTPKASVSKTTKRPTKAAKTSYRSTSKSSSRFSKRKLKEWFKKYEEEDTNEIGPDGITKFLEDIGLDPEDIKALVIAWHLDAKKMGYFTLEEWMKFEELEIDSPDKLKKRLSGLLSDLEDEDVFKAVYSFAYDFSRDPETQQKNLDLETAASMLSLMLKERNHVNEFVIFIKLQTQYKVINKDQWMTFLEFSQQVKPDLLNYDENGAWPVLLDNFVEWLKEKRGESGNES